MTVLLVGAILLPGIAIPLFYLSLLRKEWSRQYRHKIGEKA